MLNITSNFCAGMRVEKGETIRAAGTSYRGHTASPGGQLHPHSGVRVVVGVVVVEAAGEVSLEEKSQGFTLGAGRGSTSRLGGVRAGMVW